MFTQVHPGGSKSEHVISVRDDDAAATTCEKTPPSSDEKYAYLYLQKFFVRNTSI